MTTMIEKVARAICASVPGTGDVEGHFSGESPLAKELWMEMARAAIEAMREPTTAAIAAGELEYSTIYFAEEEISSHHLVELVFKSIIDAALSEEKAE